MASVETAQPLPSIDLEQPHASALLPRLLRGRVPSLLFTGPEGSGKELTAIHFARRLNCRRDDPCVPGGDACDSCRAALHLEHSGIQLIYPTPTQGSGEGQDGDVTDIAKILEEKRRDIFSLYTFPKKTSIRVARSRAVISRASTRPFDSPYDVFIFVDAHAMREEAQNALLKLVEEPAAHCAVIFTTTNPDSILYTIRSRCQRVRFQPLKPAVLEALLTSYYGIEPRAAQRAAAMAHGSIRRAKDLAETSDDSERNAAAAFVEALGRERDAWAVGQASAVGRAGNRESVARFLDEIAIVFRDLMADDPEILVNRELEPQLERMRGAWSGANLPRVIERVGLARTQIFFSNSNIDSTLADLFLRIRRSR